MSFRENGRKKAHDLTGINKITFTRISNNEPAYCFVTVREVFFVLCLYCATQNITASKTKHLC